MWMRGVLLIGLFVGRLFAAQYYVDAVGGSDSNSGTSSGSAWRTCSKIESFDASPGFAPGDLIQFRRGQTFSSCDLDLSSDGTSGNRITIQAYGTGSAPILQGTSGGTVIDLSGADWWSIRDVRTNGNNYAADTGIDAGRGTTIDTVEIDRNRCFGVRVLSGEHDVTIANSDIHHNAGHSSCNSLVGGIVANLNGTNSANNLNITGNQIHDNAGEGGSVPNGIVIGGASADSPTFDDLGIENNDIFGNGRFSQDDFGRGITGHFCSNNAIIRNNVIRNNTGRGMRIGEGSAAHACSLNASIHHNVLYHHNVSHILFRVSGTVNVYNNTLVTVGTEGRPASCFGVQSNGGTINIVNNICEIDPGGRTGVVFVNSNAGDLGTVSNNLWYWTGAGSTVDFGNAPDCNFTCHKGKGYDANGIHGQNPGFVAYDGTDNPPGYIGHDFNLSASAPSPAIGAGVVVAGVTDELTGATPDLGAMESSSSGGGSGSVSCDLSLDGVINVVDVQLALNQALGISSCAQADVTQNGSCDVVDVQRFVNAALGLGCRIGA